MMMNKKWLMAASAVGMAMFTQAQAQDSSAEKMNAYIECYNGVTERAFDSINRYQSWVQDMDQGPTGNEKTVYGLYSLNDHSVETCKEKVPAALELEPEMPELDNAAQEFLDALIPFDEKVKEANKYYDRENYKDDDFEQGKAMHPELVAVMNDFAEATDALVAAFDAQSNDVEAQEAQLAEIEKQYGKNFDYHLMAMMNKATAAVDVLSQDEFDIDQAKQLVSEYEDTADAYTDFTSANENDLPMAAAFLEQPVENYRIALKERLRRVRDNEPYSTGEQGNLNPGSGWMVKGSTFKVVHEYNNLIDAANK